jgi:hypothetical protein
VNYAKLLEMSLFFTWHIFLEVAKTQDLPSKSWQTLGDALTMLSMIYSPPSQIVGCFGILDS